MTGQKVIGSAPNDRPGPQVADLLRRLRAWNVSSWRQADRIWQARQTLDLLAGLAARQDGQARPAVPDDGVHALADQLEVLTLDALDAGVAGSEVHRVLGDLARRLGLAG